MQPQKWPTRTTEASRSNGAREALSTNDAEVFGSVAFDPRFQLRSLYTTEKFSPEPASPSGIFPTNIFRRKTGIASVLYDIAKRGGVVSGSSSKSEDSDGSRLSIKRSGTLREKILPEVYWNLEGNEKFSRSRAPSQRSSLSVRRSDAVAICHLRRPAGETQSLRSFVPPSNIVVTQLYGHLDRLPSESKCRSAVLHFETVENGALFSTRLKSSLAFSLEIDGLPTQRFRELRPLCRRIGRQFSRRDDAAAIAVSNNSPGP